jgi:hypothetical protein
VTYTYDDSAAANSKGRLTSVGSSVSSYSYGAYDAFGGCVASMKQAVYVK